MEALKLSRRPQDSKIPSLATGQYPSDKTTVLFTCKKSDNIRVMEK